MIEIEKPRIDCEQLAEDGSYGKFVVEPLERGYGLAQPVRRTQSGRTGADPLLESKNSRRNHI